MTEREGEVVCVTGGSGFIGSWLVRLLLLRGYTVRATVKDLEDEGETKHLQALEGAESRLRLFQISLLDYGSIVAAINGSVGVFHLASPCVLEISDPEKDVLEPAIKGTINVLTAAKELGVRRVVLTSSIAAMRPNLYDPEEEDFWTDIDLFRQKELWYPVSKTLAEKSAWEFAEQRGVDLVVVNPGHVLGPILPPAIGASMSFFLQLFQGCTKMVAKLFTGFVHVKDVALSHILLYENTSTTGRHLCVEGFCHYADIASKIAELYPEYDITRFRDNKYALLKRLPKDIQPKLSGAKHPSQKLIDLGLQFIPLEQIVKDAVESLKSKGFIS